MIVFKLHKRSEATCTIIGKVTLYWSYQTLIGFTTDEGGTWRCEEYYSKTTSKHLGQFGILNAPRLPSIMLEKKALQALRRA